MRTGRILVALVVVLNGGLLMAQQESDPDFKPVVASPEYEPGKGPKIAIDEAHNNYHTVTGRYKPFADLLRQDGYRVEGSNKAASRQSLDGIAVLVIANPLHQQNAKKWALPTPSAFSPDEILEIHAWVEAGGSLFLILDHMPFPGAGLELARSFGVEFSNGFAVAKSTLQPSMFVFRQDSGVAKSPVTEGRMAAERITQVATFTGSALKPPENAVQVLRLGDDFVSLLPEQAWVFSAKTPRISLKGWCQGAIMNVGKGRVAVFGEAAMFSAQISGPKREKFGMNAPEAPQNCQLLLNILHWLTHAKGMPD
jgi:hypothetical protein